MVSNFDYIRAGSWEEAAELLASYGTRAAVMAGGTDLLPAIKLLIRQPEVIIDLIGISGPESVTESADNNGKAMVLNPLMRLNQLSNDPIIQKQYPALASAASRVGSPQLRNMGTLGGNICLNTRCIFYNQSEQWRKARPPCFKMNGSVCYVQKRGKICLAEFQSDTVPVLLALNAELRLISTEGERIIPISKFYSGAGNPPNLLGTSELIREIRLPQLPEGYRASYEKFAVREGIDFATVSVATFLIMNPVDHECREARIIVSGALPSPFICRKASTILQGHLLDSERIELAAREAAHEAKPINPTGFSVPYKRHLIEVLTKRALLMK